MRVILIVCFVLLSGCTNKAYYDQQPDLARQTTANTIAAGNALVQIAERMFQQHPTNQGIMPAPVMNMGKDDVNKDDVKKDDVKKDDVNKEGFLDIQIQPPMVVNTGASDALRDVLVAQERTRQVAAFTALVEKVLLRPQHQVADPFSGERVLTKAIEVAVPISGILALSSTMKEGLRSASGPVTATVSGGSSLATETGTAKGEAPTTTTTSTTTTGVKE